MRRYLPLLFIVLAALAFVVAQVSSVEAGHRCRYWDDDCDSDRDCRYWTDNCGQPRPQETPTAEDTPTATATAVVETRDPLEWPFAADSIWNMPIGSEARYVDAQIELASSGVLREDVYLGLDPNAPVRMLNGSTSALVPGDLQHTGDWTGCAALLTTDGNSVLQGQPLELTAGGQPQWDYTFPPAPADLTGDGQLGCHGGSGLSGVGGTLRPGELSGPGPIRHALKVNVNVDRFVSCESDGYRWPAVRSHAYMSCDTFGGVVPALRMGALLAVPPLVDCDAEVTSAHARKLCHAMQDYGAYVVNDSSIDAHMVNVASDAEFGDGGTFPVDMQKVFGLLHVIDNNQPSSIGGGGVPRAPLAPAFASESGQPTPTNTALPIATPTNTNTPVIPTATRTHTPVPVATSTPTPTSTPIPAAPTATPTRTPTPVQPTATPTRTPTAVPATNTPTRTPTPVPATATPTRTPTPIAGPGTRDKYLWPFASTSIWNMPIGSNARYVPAGIEYAGAWNGEITRDDEFIGLNPNDPIRTLHNGERVHVPSWMEHDGSWNGCTSLLSEDGRTVWQGQPLELSRGGNPSWQYTYPSSAVDLYGDGVRGCHGGSGLSGFGGSLRPGELDGPNPVRHALKVNLFAERFISCSGGGYRWPAVRADSYMDCNSYGGDVPELKMGALLAIVPSVNCDTVVSSRHARKLCHAFQDYGAYVADDTYWDVHAIDLDYNAEFGDGGSFDSDMQRLFQMLHVVDNNSASSVGGGGTPRVPLAPPIGN